MSQQIRLNKFISDSGVCSRREADKFIEQGHVYVNGRRAQVGDLVSVRDKVTLNGNPIQAKAEDDFVVLAFNKPVGIVSTTEVGARDNIVDYIGYYERIFPIGRLDKESQGLIFLTNNGDIVNKILRAGNRHEKEYIVTVDKPITDSFIERMGNGVPILGEVTKKCKVVKESVYTFRIILIQGLNRQIRRMCEYFGYEVVKLERIRIMNTTLKGIPVGEWRLLEPKEIENIMEAIADSKSTVEPPRSAPQRPKKAAPQHHQAERSPRSTATKSTERPANFNPKSKELRGGGTKPSSSHRSSGRGHAGKSPKGRPGKR